MAGKPVPVKWNTAQCEKLMEGVYTILETTGCAVCNEEARKLLADAGCTVDGENVKVPRKTLQWAIEVAPKEFTLYNRTGEPSVELKPGSVNFGPAITSVKTLDYDNESARPGTMRDAENAGLLIDSLDHIGWASTLGSIFDRPDGNCADLYEVQALLHNTRKPIMYWSSGVPHLEVELQMFEAISGSLEAFQEKPFGIALCCPMDPLKHSPEGLAQLIWLARHRMPVTYIAGISFGSTGPITLAGSIAVGVADTLVGLLISQLACEGAPFVVSKMSDNVNMKTITPTHSRPEAPAANMASADVFNYLGLPFLLNLGDTGCGQFDEVAAFDIAVQLIYARRCGSNMNLSPGGFDAGFISSPIALLYCEQVLSFLDVLDADVPIDDENLALDSIDHVGPGGVFLMEEATMMNFRDFWEPPFLPSRNHDEWEQDGRRGCYDILVEKARQIIAAGPQHPLPDDVKAKVDAIVAAAEKAE